MINYFGSMVSLQDHLNGSQREPIKGLFETYLYLYFAPVSELFF